MGKVRRAKAASGRGPRARTLPRARHGESLAALAPRTDPVAGFVGAMAAAFMRELLWPSDPKRPSPLKLIESATTLPLPRLYEPEPRLFDPERARAVSEEEALREVAREALAKRSDAPHDEED